MAKGKVLGIDFGDRRVGLAVSDPGQEISFPRDFLEYQAQSALIRQIISFCSEEGIVKIVVGMPIQMTGGHGERAQKTETFLGALREALPGMEIVSFDERLSTQYAKKALHSQGIRAKNQKGKRDALAAQIILQNYLNHPAES